MTKKYFRCVIYYGKKLLRNKYLDMYFITERKFYGKLFSTCILLRKKKLRNKFLEMYFITKNYFLCVIYYEKSYEYNLLPKFNIFCKLY